MGRVPAITTLLALCAVATPSVAAVAVDVCVEPSWDAAVAVMRLDERTPGLTLRPVRPRECARSTGYSLRFVEHARRVSLVLSTPRGERLMRPIPWVERSEDAMITLARRGRLGATAVLVEGLVVEDRSMNVRPPVRTVRAEPPVADAEVPPPDAARPTPAAEPSVEPASSAGPTVVAAASTSPPRTTRRPASAEPASVRPAAPPRPAPTRRSIVEAAALDALLARPPPPPEPSPIVEPAAIVPRSVARRPAAPRPAARVDEVGAPSGGGASRPVDWGLGLDIGAAARAPDLATPEFALRLVLDRMMVRIGGHPPGEWTLEDRRLRQTALFAALAYTAPFIEGPGLGASYDVGVVGEWLAIRRQGVPGATTRNLWDVGIDGGVTLGLPVVDGWALGLRLGGTVVVANELAIPNVTRSATPGLWQLRAGLVAEWRP